MYSVDIWHPGSDLIIPHKKAQHSRDWGVTMMIASLKGERKIRAYRWMLGGDGAFVSMAFR